MSVSCAGGQVLIKKGKMEDGVMGNVYTFTHDEGDQQRGDAETRTDRE